MQRNELVLQLQRSAETSHTSSKPPSTNRKERREHAEPGGAKPGHEGHSRMLGTNSDRVVDNASQQCPYCLALSPDLPSEAVSLRERIELPRSGRSRICHTWSPPSRSASWFPCSGAADGVSSRTPPKRDYDMMLWRPALHRASPNARLRRVDAHSRLDQLRMFRNRIAYHEPIFMRHLAADHASTLLVTGWISTGMRD